MRGTTRTASTNHHYRLNARALAPDYRAIWSANSLVLTNNSTSQAAIGPVLAFAHVDGLVVSGNTQPLVSGSLLLISDCTGISIGSNP